MDFDANNEIDKQIRNIFPIETLESVSRKNVEYIGINLSSEPNSDFFYKIYYRDMPSKEIYDKNQKNPILEYLYEKDMVKILQAVYDNIHFNFSKFDIGFKNRTDENMVELFSFLEQNVPLFAEHKDEIINLAQMKIKSGLDYKYYAFHFCGFVYENGENTLFKSYWTNGVAKNSGKYNKEYYINYLKEKSDIPQFYELAQIINEAIDNCGGYLFMEGIDYTKEGAVSHKIYVIYPESVYDGLLKSIPDKYEYLKSQLLKVEKWNKVHGERFNCAGFALAKDKKNTLNLKLYYELIGE